MKRIVTIGGGHGQSALLHALAAYPYQLSAIVSTMDSGGSSGALREQFGILPPGDIRRCIIALSADAESLAQKWNARDADGHAYGNKELMEKYEELHSFQSAVDFFTKQYRCRGEVIPVTEELAHIVARLDNGETVYGEHAIDIPFYEDTLHISEVWLEPEVQMTNRAKVAIAQADIILFTMGDLYTSIIPNLLVQGVSQAIAESTAKLIYVCNRSTKQGETHGFTTKEFYAELSRYLAPATLDYMLIDASDLPFPEGTQGVFASSFSHPGTEIFSADITDPMHPQWVSGGKVAQLIDSFCRNDSFPPSASMVY